MKKVANCFMSLGSLSRARAIFNGVMSMNSFRVVLISLLMLCGNMSICAQDIITISVLSGSTRYYFADNGNGTITNPSTNLTSNCLWVIQKQGNTGNQYTFQNVGTGRWLRYASNAFSLNLNSGSACVLSTAFTSPSTEATLRGSNNGRYLRYNNGWGVNRNSGTTLTIEKWTRVETTGSVVCTPSPSSHTFTGFIEDATKSDNATITVKVEREAPKAYYQNMNNTTQKIEITSSGSTEVTQPTIDRASAIWVSSNNSTSGATCVVYGEETKKHSLLSVGAPTAKGNNTWEFPISTIGKSPMEMTTDDGKWADYSDMIRFAFHDKETDATYYANITVARYSFHEEELPNFVIETDPSSVTFSKGGGNQSLKITLTHQHGKLVRHMHGNISDNTSDYTKEVDVTREELTDLSFANFSAKKVTDETASDWLTVGTIAADGTLTLSAPANDTGGMRTARLVGLFDYTNPLDPSDQHYEYIEMQINQNAKDGNWKLIPSKGHSGDAFVKNPYTNADQQQVHTVEKTIYYTPGQAAIELRLAETAFRGYKRWYDYQTGCNPQYNVEVSDRTSWVTAPTGTNINAATATDEDSYGDSYGIYNVSTSNANIPIIKGWADGKAHIMACDVSSHKDYDVDDEKMTVTEPTLSYRQLFHLRPATEMADKFKAAASITDGSQFLENYEYTAPSGKTVMLSTQFRYKSFTKPRNSHSSEFCYYYYKNGTSGELGQVGVTADVTAKWYKVNGATLTEVENPTYPTFDYLQIAGQAANTEAEYQLIVSGVHGGKDLKIARFVVKFVDINTHGPVNSIMTQADIAARYQILEYNDFSFGAAAPGTGNMTHLYKHLPWEESTYGYFYPTNVANECDRQNTDIPYYGEYALINYYSKNWAGGAQHGGADKGYALFVDGTTEPGLVASISTDAVICSGQTLYCSVWLMNPRKNNQGGTPPVFRCNIQGRDKGDAEWKDVGVYYVGAWDNYDQNWKQVVFPIQSKVSYDETRVSVYNFGTGGDGNDFFLDDLCLFVSPLPLAAYQATMGCRSYTDNTTTSTAVVVRLDYAELNEGLQGKFAYYQLFNVTDNRVVKLKTINASNQIVPAYYAEGEANEAYGYVSIPAKTYTPKTDKGDVIATDGLQKYIEGLIDDNTRHGKCYVKDAVNNKWFLYVIHIVPNTQQNVSAADADIYLEKDKEYLLRIAHTPGELSSAECASTTELHATTDTYVELRDDRDAVERVDCKDMLCANNHYFLDVKVQNTLATSVGGTLETVEALVHADWLVGVATDDAYCNPRSMTNEEKEESNKAFEEEYGCTRNVLRQAISDMRQIPSSSKPNPNYQQADPKKLITTDDFDATELALIQRLCTEGKLKLYQTTSMFYMGSEEVVRYWIYPVAEDAKVTFKGQEYKLYDCDEPLWVRLKSQHSEYAVNLSPIDIANQKPNERLMLPSIRIIEGTEQVVIPVQQLLGKTKLHGTLSPTKEKITFNFKETIENVLEYVDLSNNRVDIVDAPTTLEPGKDYLMRMAFYDQDGYAYIGGDEKNCRVGFVYFYLSIVPNVVQWTGEASAIWGDDANWKARKEDGTLMDVGFTPLPETNVIIPALGPDKPYPIVTTDDHYPMDVNHLPNACNDIYFAPGAMIHNQHLLQYNKAFVDMKIEAANWNSMAPPLKGMYTGDMFVPHVDNNNAEYKSITDHNNYPFAVSPFQGTRTSKAPYVFWQSLYNKRATIYHENGNQSHPALTTTAIFAQTNSLGQPLPPGTGYQVLGFGPKRNESDEIIVRLPKPDTYYSYYYSNGTVSDQRAYVEHSSKLAFEPDANGDMYITLTNDLSSNQFMFGNPAMTNIDMKKFLEDPYNAQLAKKYYTMSESSWNAENWFTMEHSGSGELAPMRSVLLELVSGEAKSITIKLSKTHLVGYTEPVPAGVVARKNIVEEESGETQLMTIYATSEGGQARCILASNAYAQDIYNNEEDALFISSGVEEGVNSATATSPVNMYTVSEQVPMMVDVRENIDTVPISMLVHDSYRTEKVKFSFYLSINWNKECYFYDSVTGERYRIMDGLWLEMDMPLNHATRYFITGPDHTTNSGVVTNTTNPNVAPLQVWAYSEQAGEITVRSNDIIQSVTIYDIAGHIIARQTLDLLYNQVSLPVGQGVHIAEVTLRDNSKHYTRTIVK